MRLMQSFFRAYPMRTALMLAALLLSALAEGVGLSVLLPLLNIALGTDSGVDLPGSEATANDFEVMVRNTLGNLGIDITLSNMLLVLVSGVALKSISS
jgi:ATP-binding cassette subfamily C protein